MTGRRDVLAEILKALQQAADRLRVTHAGVSDCFPLTPDRIVALPPGEQERLDAYAIRYARCQDLLFPAMRAFARAQLEPKADGTFLELHALMQKQGIVGEPRDWERQRALRNAVSHEYPDPDAIADILNGIHAATPEILSIAKRLDWAAKRLPNLG
ncbi:hypothetical protein [Thiococcus pfennigii]|uniref:hypothetical protein n=1 Tax=Thiococcus pfennigii TaxID=1057 RepID=UPI001904B721|nr:hypothetical protein [Thiococcus pfennigii]MBK1733559.1 hypothetical protein [Thiococcus pfennigii]